MSVVSPPNNDDGAAKRCMSTIHMYEPLNPLTEAFTMHIYNRE